MIRLFLLLTLLLPQFGHTEASYPLLNPSMKERKEEKVLLKNGIKAYLISDPSTQKSGAVIGVEVGSFQDPDDHLGLAHFLEHMLFMGTKTFPEPGEAMRYVQERGGLANAFTRENSTNYMFTVNNESFEEALKRFSLFFQEPLFNPNTLDRERHAIDQEYAKNLDNSYVRQISVLKDLSKDSHPYSRFTMGNKKSLKDATDEDLKNFFQRHYTADKMHLILLSPLPISSQIALLNKYFSPIPKKQASPPQTYGHPLPHSLKGSLITLESKNSTSRLSLIWEIDPKFTASEDHNLTKLLSHVLGHEGKNSLLNTLKEKHLVQSLSSGTYFNGRDSGQLVLEMELTKEGKENINVILDETFKLISFMRKTPFPKSIFDEVHTLDRIKYQYKKRQEPFNELMETALILTETPFDSFPEKTYVIQNYSVTAMQAFIETLTPNNLVVLLSLPKDDLNPQEYDKKEPWVDVSYKVDKLPDQLLTMLNNSESKKEINYPKSNPYIPLLKDTPQTSRTPFTLPNITTLIDNDLMIAYAAKDNYFYTQKGYFAFQIQTPHFNPSDPKEAALAKIFIKNVQNELQEDIYFAHLADLELLLTTNDKGFLIKVSGFNDKADLFLNKIFQTLKECHCEEKPFNLILDELRQKAENFETKSSLEQAQELFYRTFKEGYVSQKDLLEALNTLSYSEYTAFIKKLFNESFTTALTLSEDPSLSLLTSLINHLKTNPVDKKLLFTEEVKILPKETLKYIEEHKNHSQGNSLILAIESPDYSFQKRAAQQILMELIKEPYFASLRTDQQTGYIVFSSPLEMNKVLFNLFAIQSNSHSSMDLLYRTESFIERFARNLKMEESIKRFDTVKKAQIALLRKPKESLEELGEELSLLAFDYEADFQWMQKRLHNLENLDFDTFLTLSTELLGQVEPRKMGLLVEGKVYPKVLTWQKAEGDTDVYSKNR